jgi:hypothetical protein
MDPLPFPLERLRDDIIRLAAPESIRLFNQKTAPDGSLSSVKLCVVIPGGDPQETERRLYMDLDCDIPFDVLVYSREGWDRRTKEPGSFASRIQKTGSVLYAADPSFR